MLRRCLAYAVVVACSSSTVLVLPAIGETRGTVELFTSQGCSSCPPADRLLGELAADPTLVAITLSVDIWDYLGWRDTLADPRNTLRQKIYSKVRGDREVYTPQAVVNGSRHALGSDKAAIEHAIAKSRQNPMALSVPIKLSVADGRLTVAVPDGTDLHAGAELWICALAKAVTVAIKRGENRGRTITYYNVVRRWLKVDSWNGKTKTWTVPIRDFDGEGIDRAAVMLQAGTIEKPTTMLGAAIAAIR